VNIRLRNISNELVNQNLSSSSLVWLVVSLCLISSRIQLKLTVRVADVKYLNICYRWRAEEAGETGEVEEMICSILF